MVDREKIIAEAVEGADCTPEWVAIQQVRMYRSFMEDGYSHSEALSKAKCEMAKIKDETLKIRKKQRREAIMVEFAPWFVIILGALAAYGWWQLWE